MESVGIWLKQARELRGLTLEDVAGQTKIRLHALVALEADDVQNLPAAVFVAGFVRQYALAVGLSADEAALRYEEQRQAAATEEMVAPRRRRGRSWLSRLIRG